jgi:hypothetical protein
VVGLLNLGVVQATEKTIRKPKGSDPPQSHRGIRPLKQTEPMRMVSDMTHQTQNAYLSLIESPARFEVFCGFVSVSSYSLEFRRLAVIVAMMLPWRRQFAFRHLIEDECWAVSIRLVALD